MQKTRLFSTLFVVAILAAGAFGQGCGLTTHFAANNGQSGNMFDIVAQNPAGIEVTGFTCNLDSGNWNIEIYVLSAGGTHVGNEGTPGAWTLVETFNNVPGFGINIPAPLPPLNLPANPNVGTWPASVVANIGPNGGYNVASGATQAFYVTANNGTGMNYQTGSTTTVGAVFASNPDLDFLAGVGNVYPFGGTFSPRIWSGVILYTFPGQVLDYETNTATASMDISGAFGDSCTPAVISKTLVTCPGVPVVPITDTLNVSVSGNPGAFYEIAANLGAPGNLLPLSGGGLALPQNGEIVNLSILALSFINGGAGILLTPMPSFPGASGASFGVPFANGAATDFAVEGAITNAAAAGGFELTQATEYHIATVAAPPSIPGPTGDDQIVTFDPTAPPTCWLTAPWTMYGSAFTEMHVDSNGRLMAAFDASDFSPTLAEALSGPATVGIWTDLSPNAGGGITINNPSPGVIDIDFAAVPYFGTAGGANTFTMEYDDGSGNLSLISDIAAGTTPFATNLTSTGTAGNMFVGITPGTLGPATDPGIVNGGLGFTVGGAGVPAAGTDMLYDFLDTSIVGAPTLPVSFNGTALVRIDFLPAPVGGVNNYAFNGL